MAAEGKRELVYDSDYGSVPTFYTWLHVGAWDKPYINTAAPVAVAA